MYGCRCVQFMEYRHRLCQWWPLVVLIPDLVVVIIAESLVVILPDLVVAIIPETVVVMERILHLHNSAGQLLPCPEGAHLTQDFQRRTPGGPPGNLALSTRKGLGISAVHSSVPRIFVQKYGIINMVNIYVRYSIKSQVSY